MFKLWKFISRIEQNKKHTINQNEKANKSNGKKEKQKRESIAKKGKKKDNKQSFCFIKK